MDKRLPIPEWLPEPYHQAWRALDSNLCEESDDDKPIILTQRDKAEAAMVRNACLDGLDKMELAIWWRKLLTPRASSVGLHYHVKKIAQELGNFTVFELASSAGVSIEYTRRFVHLECQPVGRTRRTSTRDATVFVLKENDNAGNVDY